MIKFKDAFVFHSFAFILGAIVGVIVNALIEWWNG
jgi:hypothetical protein